LSRLLESAAALLSAVTERGAKQAIRVTPSMRPYLTTILLLTCSNIFMTYAWYGHLKNLSTRPWLIAALVSWGIAFFEYMLQVPANRTGHVVMSLGQLKILQEVIALSVFVPFAVIYMKEKLTLDYLWASCCIAAAAYFIFRRG
jgi:uncharacterized protein